jgi:hypothetical protein
LLFIKLWILICTSVCRLACAWPATSKCFSSFKAYFCKDTNKNYRLNIFLQGLWIKLRRYFLCQQLVHINIVYKLFSNIYLAQFNDLFLLRKCPSKFEDFAMSMCDTDEYFVRTLFLTCIYVTLSSCKTHGTKLRDLCLLVKSKQFLDQTIQNIFDDVG